MQHLREAPWTTGKGILAGTNTASLKSGGRQPMTLEEFINKNRGPSSDLLITD